MNRENFTEQKDLLSLNPVRLIKLVLSNFKWILLCLSIAFLIAFFVNKYTKKIYKASTLIYINSDAPNPFLSSAPLHPLLSSASGDKIEKVKKILKSRLHNEKVVDFLNLRISYYGVDAFNFSEVFQDESPFYIEYDKGHCQWIGQFFEVETIDDRKFRLFVKEIQSDQFEIPQNNPTRSIKRPSLVESYKKYLEIDSNHKFGEWIESPVYKFRLLRNNRSINEFERKKFRFLLHDKDQIVGDFIDQIEFKQEPSSVSLLTIEMKGGHLKKIVDYLNNSVDLLLKEDLLQKNRIPENTARFIESKLSSIREDLSNSSEHLKSVRAVNKIIDLSAQGNYALENTLNIENQRAELERQLDVLQLFQRQLHREDYSSLSLSGVKDPVLFSAVQMMNQLLLERGKKLEIYTPSSAPIKQIDRQMNLLKKQSLKAIGGYISGVQTQISDLKKQLIDIDHQLRNLPLKEQKYIDAQRLYLINNEQYNQMLLKHNEALLIKESNVPNIDVIESAKDTHQKYVAPRPVLNYFIAFFLGFFLPVGYLILCDFFDERVKSLEDFLPLITAPFLGGVRKNQHSSHLVVWEHPRSSTSESFRTLRSNLKFLDVKKDLLKQTEGTKAHQSTTVMITSSVSGEGKTFVSVNLSCTFAISNYKTLLIGTDMRKPEIFKYFNLQNTKGLSNYLAGMVDKGAIVQKTKIPNLDFISSGPLPPNPSELIAGCAFGPLIEGLKKEYDYIIMDTAPLVLVADALEIVKYSDYNLYIVRENYSNKSEFLLMDKKFQKKEIERLAFVFNGYSEKRKYYSYGYFDEERFDQKNLINRWIARLKNKK